jgi:hypothetical protein
MNKIFTIAVCGAAALALSAAPGVTADNPIGQAVQKLGLTPQQLLSLRDFLGPFNRGAEVEASEAGSFVLRDAASMIYAGEFSLRMRGDGALQVDRIAGPARLDFSRTVQLPLRLLAKSRAQAIAVLTPSQILSPPPAPGGEPSGAQPLPALPSPQLAGLARTPSDSGSVAQWQAVFLADGSGTVSSMRAVLGTPATPMRITSRYYAPVRSDGTRVWRDAVLEFNSDVQLDMNGLETRYSCPAPDACSLHIPTASSTAFHMIRWQRELIPAVPPRLLAQLAPPPSPGSAITQPAESTPTQNNPAAPSETVQPSPDAQPTSPDKEQRS